MTREEAKSCKGTIEMLQRLAYNIHGVMDVIDADNCKKIIKAIEQEPRKGHWIDKERIMFPICSKCGLTSVEKYSFCPNCGAKMESEENGNAN